MTTQAQLSFALSSDLLVQCRTLNEQIQALHHALKEEPPELKMAIHRYARISMIGASTRIENAVLTDSEIEWIDTVLTLDGKPTAFTEHKHQIEDKLSKDRERSIEEVAGCRGMLDLIYSQGKDWTPLSEMTLRGLHQELLQYYPAASHYLGTYKTVSNSVVETNHATGQTRSVFKTADPGPLTATAMRDLVEWYNTVREQEAWSIAVASELTYRFLAIHPFQDGNGRLGRGLFLLALLQSPDKALAEITPYLAIDRHIEKHRSQYYQVLNRCSNGLYQANPQDYHIEYFLKFMLDRLSEALADVGVYKQRFLAHQKLSEAAHRVITCFKERPEVRLSVKVLHEMTSLPKRTISYSLNTLLAENLIQRYGQGAAVRYQLVF